MAPQESHTSHSRRCAWRLLTSRWNEPRLALAVCLRAPVGGLIRRGQGRIPAAGPPRRKGPLYLAKKNLKGFVSMDSSMLHQHLILRSRPSCHTHHNASKLLGRPPRCLVTVQASGTSHLHTRRGINGTTRMENQLGMPKSPATT